MISVEAVSELKNLYKRADDIVTRTVGNRLYGNNPEVEAKISFARELFVIDTQQLISCLLDEIDSNTYVTMKCNWIPISQTAVRPEEEYRCGSCDCMVNKNKSVFCEHCGSKLNWNDVRKKVDENV